MTPGTVLVTGAAGGLGPPVLRALRARGWTTRALLHRRPVPEADEHVRGALEDADSLRAAAAGADAVLHLAAVTHSRSPRRYRSVNVEGTQRLLAAAAEAGVRRVLLVSTRAVDPAGGAYSASKAEAEAAVRAGGVAWTIVRLPEVYGAGGGEGVDDVIARAARGVRIPLVGRGDDVLCPAHVDDVATACAAALDAPAAVGRTYTLAGECLTVRELAVTASELAGREPRFVEVPVPAVAALAAASRVLPLPLYPDQLRRLRAVKPAPSPEAEFELGFRPRPLRDGLAPLVARA